MIRRLSKIALWVSLAALTWGVVLGSIIWTFGAHDGAAEADCIIVLGAAVYGEVPSPVFEERIRHGITLYEAGYAPKLIFTGGFGEGETYSESRVAQSFALGQGVSSSDILLEENSRTTRDNLLEAKALMEEHGMTSAILVSDPLHMKRAMMMAGDLGMIVASSPTPTSRYRSFRTKFGFLVREMYFIHRYVLTGA